jgi:shikimate kinase
MKLKITKPIVLVGLMGSGKSTIGKRLAKRLSLQFYDSDRVIEEREGLSVVDIHDFRGEAYFREKERMIIKELLSYGPTVVSTGGNSFMDEETRITVKSKATSVWLSTDISTLYERVSKRNTRPELNCDNKFELLEKLSIERLEIYSETDIKIESNDGDVYFLVDALVSRLQKFLQSPAA